MAVRWRSFPARSPAAWAAALVAVLALAHLAALCFLFARRLTYPFDIEWMEGGGLVEAWRLRQGLPLYVPPSAGFIPFPYPPLHPWLLAWLSRILFLQVGYALGRAVSVAAFAGACAAIGLAVRREGGKRWEALGAIGVLAAGFAFVGGWFDLVRVDSLYLALATGGFAVLRGRGERWPGVVAGAALLALASFTKQTASLFLAAGAVALLAMRARLVPLYIAVGGGLTALGSAWLEWRSDGWFRRYVFEVLAAHSVHPEVMFARAWERMLAGLWPIVGLAAIAWILALKRREGRAGLAFWSVFAAAGALAAALGASIQWSVDNVYMPALYGAAAVAGVSASSLRRLATGAGRFVGPLAIAAQLALFAYDPDRFLPGENAPRAERFVARLAAMRGEILVPHHPFAAVEAGKAGSFHVMALGAAQRAGIAMPADLRRAIAAQRYAAIVLDRPLGRDLDLWSTYKLAEFLPESERPRTLTGFAIQPRYLLVPKRAELPAAGTVPLIDFESGSWQGWQVSGHAFGPQPAGGPTRLQGPVGPFGGRFFANSGHPTARATGRAVSPEFEIPAPRVRLMVGGARSPALAARLLVDGRSVRFATGAGDDELRRVEWEVADFVGRRARLELVDEDADGYLLADDLQAPVR